MLLYLITCFNLHKAAVLVHFGYNYPKIELVSEIKQWCFQRCWTIFKFYVALTMFSEDKYAGCYMHDKCNYSTNNSNYLKLWPWCCIGVMYAMANFKCWFLLLVLESLCRISFCSGAWERGGECNISLQAVVFICTQGVCDLMNMYYIKFVGCQTNINVREDALWRDWNGQELFDQRNICLVRFIVYVCYVFFFSFSILIEGLCSKIHLNGFRSKLFYFLCVISFST